MTRPASQEAEPWDVLVIGAGPAGAMAAHELARRGASVLIVDKAVFPRTKVCGCCLSPAALRTLERAGLAQLCTRFNAPRLNTLHVACGSRSAKVRLRGGVAISRAAFDEALIAAAAQRGAVFHDGTLATLMTTQGATDKSSCQCSRPRVALRRGSERWTVEAGALLVADGLGGRFLDHHPGFIRRTVAGSRLGLGAIADCALPFYRPGVIYMTCGPGGYLGLVRLEDGRLDLGAAVDADFVRAAGGPGAAAAQLIERAGWPALPGVNDLAWRGTPALTRARRPSAADRIFVLGDSLGYVEPFTGEGIAWALTSGAAVATPAMQAIHHWSPALAQQWRRTTRRLLMFGQWRCRGVAWALRRSGLVKQAVRCASVAPQAAERVAAWFAGANMADPATPLHRAP